MNKPWSLSKILDEGMLRHEVVVKRMTDQQIADKYNTTAPTIRYHRLRANPPIKRESAPRVDHRADGAIPWVLDVGQGHHMDPTARLLRTRNLMKHNSPRVTADAARRVKEMEDHLMLRGWVINYTRERGFFPVDRDKRLDKPDSIVRVPPKQERR